MTPDADRTATGGSLYTVVFGTALCLLAMGTVSWVAWDSVPELVTTREATRHREETQVPRWIILLAFPVANLIVTGAVLLAPRAEYAVEHRFGLRLGARDAAAKRRTLTLVLVLLSVLFLVLHVVSALVYAGSPVPAGPLVLAAIGGFLAALGGLLPAIGRATTLPTDPRLRRLIGAWRDAHTVGGRVMVGTGVAVLASASVSYAFGPLPSGTVPLVTGAGAFVVLLPFAVMVVRMVLTLRGSPEKQGRGER